MNTKQMMNHCQKLFIITYNQSYKRTKVTTNINKKVIEKMILKETHKDNRVM